MAKPATTRRLTAGELESLSGYYVAHKRYEAMRRLLRYEDWAVLKSLELSGKSVLELGCGSLPVMLAIPPGDFTYVGTDSCENGVLLARRLAPEGRFVVCDAAAPGFARAQFDVVLMKNLLHHLESPAECLRAVQHLLSPAGILIVLEPNSRCLASNIAKTLLHWFGRDLEESPYGQLKVEQLREAFRATGFEVMEVRHSGLLAFPISGDCGRVKVIPMWVFLWRAVIGLDRLLSGPLLKPGWLAPWLGFKVIFRLRSKLSASDGARWRAGFARPLGRETCSSLAGQLGAK